MSRLEVLFNKIVQQAFGASAAPILVATFFSLAPAAATELHGAGATFPAPLYKAWIERFQKDHPGVILSYEPVGSGEGLARFASGAVDFAASDVAAPTMGDERSEGVGAQFPVTAGMVAIAYNLQGVAGQLKLPREVYTRIFQGKIRRWDDPDIAAANPHLRLPGADIAVIARQDSSGTTFAFTNHLAAIGPSWSESGLGVGKKVSWPSSMTLAQGNEGVASLIKTREGAIGYVEYGFAKRFGLKVASLENKEGRFVPPSPESGAAAINLSAYLGLESLKASILDPSGAGAYPIVSYSWLLLHWDYPEDRLRIVSSFVDFILAEGQKMALDLGYVPLPAPVAYRGKAVVARVFPSEGREGALATAAPTPANATPSNGRGAAAPPKASGPARQ
jgi:phosphate transport system substrate-binding protein